MVYRLLILSFSIFIALTLVKNVPVFALEEGLVKSKTSLELVESIIRNNQMSSGKDIMKSVLVKSLPKNVQQEFKLDLMYSASIFLPLWTAQEYEESIKSIEQMQLSPYKPAKMYLYEAIYYKNKGEWSIASQLVKYALKIMEKRSDKTLEQKFLTAKALFIEGILAGDQKLITGSIDLMEKVVNKNPDNVLYLLTLMEMFDYIDVPADLYSSYEERITLYRKKYEELKSEILLKNTNNILYLKEKFDDYYYKEVKKPLIEEILRKWKKVHNAQTVSAELMYVFQLNKNRMILNIKLLAQRDASQKVKNISEAAITNAAAPYLPEKYPLKTMEILFIFTYHR